jgi:hypothetical protein
MRRWNDAEISAAGLSVSRRKALGLTGAALVFGGGVSIQRGNVIAEAATEIISDEEAIAILKEESEPGFKFRVVIKNYWFQQSDTDRKPPNWPLDELSFDYRHIAKQVPVGTEFALSVPILQVLLKKGGFQIRNNLRRTLFGLRGCVLPTGQGPALKVPTQRLVTVRPDHINLRCVIGVWDREEEVISLFPGSTVPNVDLMYGYTVGTWGCNMMPTGLHQYKVGPHRGPRQPGAFRQQKPLWVLRSRERLEYAADDSGVVWDDLDGLLPFDNVHAAMLDERSRPPFFSSAGCQVVAGRYRDGIPTGAWAEFRKAAGLAHPPAMRNQNGITSDDGRDFDYLLLTGDEAAAAAAGLGGPPRTLRYGSAGPLVAELQDKLGMRLTDRDGVFGRGTLGEYLRWRQKQGLPLTPVVSENETQALGLAWDA